MQTRVALEAPSKFRFLAPRREGPHLEGMLHFGRGNSRIFAKRE